MSLEIPPPEPIVAVRDVLPTLGFVEDQLGFQFKRGNVELTANEATSLYFQPVVHIGGMWSTPRSLGSIEFDMPQKVESTEQAVAWIVYGIGTDFVPSVPIDWLEDGKRWQHLLPWEQQFRQLRQAAEEHRKLRLARPHCLVAPDDEPAGAGFVDDVQR